MAASLAAVCCPTRAPSLDPTAGRVQALGSRPAARPVNFPEVGQGRGQLQVTAEAFEARLVCEPLLHAMDELVDRRVAGVAQLEAAALPALLAAHVDAHRPQSATGAIWPSSTRKAGAWPPSAARPRPSAQPGVPPAARFFTPWAAARKASLVPAARTPIGTACAIPWPSFTRNRLRTRQRLPSGDGSSS